MPVKMHDLSTDPMMDRRDAVDSVAMSPDSKLVAVRLCRGYRATLQAPADPRGVWLGTSGGDGSPLATTWFSGPYDNDERRKANAFRCAIADA